MSSKERVAGVPGAQKQKPSPQLPGYEIEAEVGRGGMGIVYRARQTSIDREVAVKLLPSRAAKDPVFVERFLREAKAAARLSHENVVQAIDAGRAGDTVYFVMEFVTGETARERLDREGPLPLGLALRVLRDTARALCHAHAQGLVHRDVKPDNIMLHADGRALLCDLGLARPAEESRAAQGKRTGIAEGTPYYISPEQARGFADIDIRADIYSLGTTAYHLLAGEYPYDGADAREIMLKQVNQPFPDVTEARSDLPPALVTLIATMVSKKREERIQDPSEVVAALERIMVETGTATVATVAVDALDPGRMKRLAVASVGVLAALAMAIIGGSAILKKKPEPPRTIVAPAGEQGPSVVRRDPPPGPAPADTAAAREAEAALKLSALVNSLAESQADIDGSIRRYRELAAAYPGTRAAGLCEDEIRKLEEHRGEALAKQLVDVDAVASNLTLKDEFLAAMTAYRPLLDREKGGAGEARVKDHIARIENACEAVEARREAEWQKEAQDGWTSKLEETIGKALAFAAKATPKAAERAKRFAERLKAEIARTNFARRADEHVERARDRVRKGEFKAAIEGLESDLKDSQLARSVTVLAEAKREAECAQRAWEAVSAGLARLQTAGKDHDWKLLAGGVAKGRVQSYDAGESVVHISGASGVRSALRLADLDPAVLKELGLADDSPGAHLGNGQVFLDHGALEAGIAELDAAFFAGVELSAPLRQDLRVAKSSRSEAMAEAVHRRATDLAGLAKWPEVLEKLGLLVGKGDLARTAYARAHQDAVREAWVTARGWMLADAPLKTFWHGKVEQAGNRTRKVKITYPFASDLQAALADWKPANDEEEFRHSGVSYKPEFFSFTGRVLWRGSFKGDMALQAKVRGSGARGLGLVSDVNANFVIYDQGRAWDGWFCGIGASIPEMSKLTLGADAPPQPMRVFEFPSHVMGHLAGTAETSSWLWASRGPPAPPQFDMTISARHGVLQLSLMGSPFNVNLHVPQEQQRGSVAIMPFTTTLHLSELTLSGEVDDQWLKAEALRRAKAELAGMEQ